MGAVDLHRWTADLLYRRDGGVTETRTVAMHELADLHDIVEAGPNFYALAGILIYPPRHSEPLTIEQAEQL